MTVQEFIKKEYRESKKEKIKAMSAKTPAEYKKAQEQRRIHLIRSKNIATINKWIDNGCRSKDLLNITV